jgi:hypothetical protein
MGRHRFLLFLCWIGWIPSILGAQVSGQTISWDKLIPLESTRTDVEKILGKPELYFKSFGTYKTEFGKFSVWYSKGGCVKNSRELQYNVPAGKFVNFIVYLRKEMPLEAFVKDKANYIKSDSPFMSGRFFYTSPDRMTVYETVPVGESAELLYSISVGPQNSQQRLLCGSK